MNQIKVIPNILVFADYGKECYTGYARVATNVLAALKKHFGENIHFEICATNNYLEPYTDDIGYVFSGKHYEDYHAPKEMKEKGYKPDDYARMGFLSVLNKFDWTGVWILQDVSTVSRLCEVMKMINIEKQKKNKKQFKTIFYFPIDGDFGGFTNVMCNGIELLELPVTFTEFGRGVVLKHKPELKGKLKVIPHGTNQNEFYPLPLEDRQQFRKEYFKDNADKFIICNINRNNPRKDIPATILGFKQYLEINPNAFLYLHTDPNDPVGHQLYAIMKQAGLEEYEHYMFPFKQGVDTETLNKIYNACDAGLTTAAGGGWEYFCTESFATLLPLICPRNSSMAEIGEGRALFIEDYELRVTTADNVIRPYVFADEVCEKLDILYQEIQSDSADLKRRVDNGKRYVDGLRWSNVAKTWIKYFEDVFKIK